MLKKSGKLFGQALDELDIFDEPIHFNLKGEKTIKSKVGGLISLAVMVFLAVQTIIQVVAMFNRNGPSIIQMYEYQDDPQILYLNNTNNFMFAVSFTNNNSPMNLSVDSLFSFTSTFSQYIRNADGSQTKYKPQINWAPCQAENFSTNVFSANTFSSYNLQYAYCPESVNYTDITTGVCPSAVIKEYPDCIAPLDFKIRGNFLSGHFDFISFRLTECDQDDALHIEGLQCKSGDITSAFDGNELQINLYYSNSLIDPTNHQTPNKTYLDTIYWNVNPSVSRVADIFVDIETVVDADSYISTDDSHNSTYYSIQSDKTRELQQFSTDYMLQWNLRRSNVNHVTTRTYTTVLDVISDIGGLGGIFMAVGFIVTAGYTKFKYQMILSNKLYDYESVSKPRKAQQNENPIQAKQKTSSRRQKSEAQAQKYQIPVGEKSEDIASLNLTSPKITQRLNPSKTIKKYFEHLFDIKRKMPYNEFSYLKALFALICCRRNPEQQIARKARQQIILDLDITRIIEKLQEIDKLKMLLLNRYQREAFNYIEKPVITLEEGDPKHRRGSLNDTQQDALAGSLFEIREEYKSLSRYAKLYASYRHLTSDVESQNSKYNRKLLEMLGPELIKVFKQIDHHMSNELDPSKFEEVVNRLMGDVPKEFVKNHLLDLSN